MNKSLVYQLIAFVFFALILCNNSAKAQRSQTVSGDTTQLGEVTIIGYRDSLNSIRINSKSIAQYNRLDVAQALNLLPGITLSAVGPRNESMINVRGFDLKQVPVYLDGIPVYVPYDGYVDLARFTTFDISEIQVAKGYSSVLYGPNAEGGAINLISRKPVKKLDLNYSAGWMSGGHRLYTSIGSKVNKFYYQADVSQLKRKTYPLSDDFIPAIREDGGDRDNSYSDDIKGSAKIGLRPDYKQEYVVGYSYQRGRKGTPVYTGADTQNPLLANPRFWKWPNWDKQNIYFISNNSFGLNNSIKTRWYRDQFKNTLSSYDDATYTKQTRGYAFTSVYNDYTLGNSITFENTSLTNNSFSLAGHFKQDVHREHNLGEPERRNADNNFTLGAEDTYQISDKLKINGGLSYMLRKSVATQQYNSTAKNIYDLPKNSNSAWNIQGLAQYNFNGTDALSFSVARRTRFATIKDRYSFRLGTAIPNPDLNAETALNYDLSYKGSYLNNLSLQVSTFYSRIDNSIQMVSNVQGTLSQIQNTGEAEYYGAEAGIGYNIGKQIQLNANYTHIVRKNIASPAIFFTDVPRHKVFASIQYKPMERLYILASTEYNSERYSTSYGTVAQGFGLTNVTFHTNIYNGLLSLEAGGNNLFDKNYQLVEGFPQAGRTFFTTLILKY